jgi:hypothetical protein
MSLTKQEALVAASAALKYPVGHGHDWGWGPLKDVEQREAADKVITNPKLGKLYG